MKEKKTKKGDSERKGWKTALPTHPIFLNDFSPICFPITFLSVLSSKCLDHNPFTIAYLFLIGV